MIGWILIVLVVAAIAIFVLLSIYVIRRFCCHIRKKPVQTTPPPAITLQNGIARLHHSPLQPHQININVGGSTTNSNKRRTNYYVFRRGLSSKPLFSWADNPSLVTDAVENGWSRFAFTTYTSSPSVRSTSRSILGPCAGDAGNDHIEVQISWEVCQGSADFMQKIRLNSGLKKAITSMGSAASVIKSALPLPGPPLGNSSSFPQEAYFEITILTNDEDNDDDNNRDLGDKVKASRKIEGEKIKLIQESPNEKAKSESLVHITNGNGHNLVDDHHHELRHDHGSVKDHEHINDRKVKEVVALSVGLSGGGSLPSKLPGSYPGSIGFNSDGSVLLDGIKLVFESEKDKWGSEGEKVIGCGYNPMQKRVFFTVDSQLVHEIYCKTEEFGTPLYPTLAANVDIMVLVNFGQCVFQYAPANSQRTPNPCFVGPLGNSPALGYEDSKELFSMGRIDSQWLNRSTTRGFMLHNASNHKGGADYDDVSEGDLFEIMLDSSYSTGRSPNTPL